MKFFNIKIFDRYLFKYLINSNLILSNIILKMYYKFLYISQEKFNLKIQ